MDSADALHVAPEMELERPQHSAARARADVEHLAQKKTPAGSTAGASRISVSPATLQRPEPVMTANRTRRHDRSLQR